MSAVQTSPIEAASFVRSSRQRLASRFQQRRLGLRALLATLLSGFSLAAIGATYYVDPQTGNDANAGTSQSSPWRTIPGTRTTSDSGWLRTTWGSISSSNKVKAGDTIELKAGATMNSTIGGRLLIDSTYFSNGTSASPIAIQVSPAWGSGPFTYDMAGVTNPKYRATLEIRMNYIRLAGVNDAQRFVVANAPGPGDWSVLVMGTSSTHTSGQQISYLEVRNGSKIGLDVAYADNWTVSNTVSHDNGSMGIGVGGLNDSQSRNGLIVDSEAYRNGVGAGSSDIAHGFGLYGSLNITYLRCKSHDNGRDGFDFGTTSNSNSTSAKVVDSVSYNNGEDGFGVNSGPTGTVAIDYINVIVFNNDTSGWQIYDGAIVGIYHSVAHNNGNDSSFSGNILTYGYGSAPAPQITLRNNVFYKPKRFAQIGSYTGKAATINSDYNIWVPRSSNSETFSDYPFGTYKPYTSPPSWIGPHDKVGIAFDPGFRSAGTTSFGANDYHLTSSAGPAIRAGVALTIPYADKDRDETLRAVPPDIGGYQYSTTSTARLPPPTALRVQ